MRKQAISVGGVMIAALTATALSLPPTSVAQADPARTAYRNLYNRAQTRCAWPYQNQFPPCMSTWPEGDPRFHGGQTGPTFNK
jgi:hypothetical protein